MAADIVVSFTEEPRKTNTRGGRHVEFGAALAAGKRCIVIGHRENVFHCLPEVEFYADWHSARRALDAAGIVFGMPLREDGEKRFDLGELEG